ncbi:c2 domain-containing protein [Anaeramoeba ignava]|uniref:C2 domain-containing protein n=1 Tax=Anaeramoeba ignava TaxID=1746090 RepID=A0A9Q0RE16_ANAIG|nr:c2 domain-containing protein [Anaeramoeba ignava]
MTTPIHIKVIEAKGLKSADIGGKSDPYYSVSINGVKPFFKSKTIKGTLDPVWNETHVLNCKNDQLNSAKIIVGISDWDRIGAHDLLGFIRINVSTLLSGEPLEKWYDCEGRKPGTKEKVVQQVQVQQQPMVMNQQQQQQPMMMNQQQQQQPMMMNQQQPMMMNQQQPMMMNQQPMMMGQQQPMMMGQQPMMMGQQPMMMGQQPMMMPQQPMMMPNQPMMMPNQTHISHKDKKKHKKEKKGLGKQLKKAWKNFGGSSS